jgi:hypothetical protein
MTAAPMAAGALAGLTVPAGLLALNMGGLRDMALNDPLGGLATLALALLFASTFAAAAFGASLVRAERTAARRRCARFR